MQMQLSKAIQAHSLCEKIKEQKMPLMVAYKFAQLMNNLEPQVSFYKERYTEILRTYAQVGEDGNFISDDDGNIKLKDGQGDECIKKINELENFSISIEKVEFKLDQLEELSLTPSEVQTLLPFIME